MRGTDEHGVAITLKAEQEGLGYREYVDRWHDEIKGLFDRFQISFDHWSGTARCEQHAEASRRFFRILLERGHIFDRTEEQWFSPTLDRFLPDRYIEGTCPHCGYGEARGDQCDNCGRTLDATDLIDPRSKISGAAGGRGRRRTSRRSSSAGGARRRQKVGRRAARAPAIFCRPGVGVPPICRVENIFPQICAARVPADRTAA